MKPDFFTQLESDLGALARNGAHLGDPAARGRRRVVLAARRSLAILTLATALAASLDSEFPAAARGLGNSAPPALVQAP